MAYSRWSTPIPGCGTSQWYIYWDTVSDDQQGRNGQALSILHTANDDLPILLYPEIRRIADEQDWPSVPGYCAADPEADNRNMRDCLTAWLAEVEEQFPPAEIPSRLQQAELMHRTVTAAAAEVRASHRNGEPILLTTAYLPYRHAMLIGYAATQAERSNDASAAAIRRLADEARDDAWQTIEHLENHAQARRAQENS